MQRWISGLWKRPSASLHRRPLLPCHRTPVQTLSPPLPPPSPFPTPEAAAVSKCTHQAPGKWGKLSPPSLRWTVYSATPTWHPLLISRVSCPASTGSGMAQCHCRTHQFLYCPFNNVTNVLPDACPKLSQFLLDRSRHTGTDVDLQVGCHGGVVTGWGVAAVASILVTGGHLIALHVSPQL